MNKNRIKKMAVLLNETFHPILKESIRGKVSKEDGLNIAVALLSNLDDNQGIDKLMREACDSTNNMIKENFLLSVHHASNIRENLFRENVLEVVKAVKADRVEDIVTERFEALKNKTYEHLISSPMSFFSQKRVGELSSRISSDISLLQETFTITIAELIRQFITIPVGLFFLFYISSRLTIFIIAVIPVIALIGVFFGKFIKKLSVIAQDDITESNKVVDETLHGIANVKAYANEFYEIIRYKSSIDQSVETSIKRAKWRVMFIGLIMFVAGSALMAIIWYGLHMVQLNEADPTKGITIGELLQFALYAAFLGVSLGGTADLFSQLQK